MATQPERLATLETSVRHVKGVTLVLVPLVLAWAAYITLSVISMKQSLLDNGTTKLLAQLTSPASTQQLQANLSTVIAQVKTARANATTVNTKKALSLSNAISEVAVSEPNLPEVWQAAGELISYRSGDFVALQNSPVPCGTEGNKPTLSLSKVPNSTDILGNVGLSNCTLYLDQPDRWKMGIATIREPANDSVTISIWHLSLRNVIVHYNGGPLTDISGITFDHCILDFQLNRPPALAPERSMTIQLLASANPSRVEVILPNA